MLEVENLTVSAGSFVVRDVSLSVKAGSCHVLLGSTGSGKTLFLETLIGLRKPVRGTIRIDGTDVTQTPIEERHFGYVPQDLALFPHMTARENILYAARVNKIHCRAAADADLFDRIVSSLGITHILTRGVRSLSGGERQRVALARALFSGSRVLILDEPLSSLHEGLRRELWFVLKDLAQAYDVACLMVTHDLEEAFFLGDDVTVLLKGRVCQQGTVGTLLERPQTIEVADFLGIRNVFTLENISAACGISKGRCHTLGCELTVCIDADTHVSSHSNFDCDKLVVGIHAKDVILHLAEPPLHECNLIPGVVKSVYRGRTHAVAIIQPVQGISSLECALPLPDAAWINGLVGTVVYCKLPEERLFVLGYE